MGWKRKVFPHFRKHKRHLHQGWFYNNQQPRAHHNHSCRPSERLSEGKRDRLANMRNASHRITPRGFWLRPSRISGRTARRHASGGAKTVVHAGSRSNCAGCRLAASARNESGYFDCAETLKIRRDRALKQTPPYHDRRRAVQVFISHVLLSGLREIDLPSPPRA